MKIEVEKGSFNWALQQMKSGNVVGYRQKRWPPCWFRLRGGFLEACIERGDGTLTTFNRDCIHYRDIFGRTAPKYELKDPSQEVDVDHSVYSKAKKGSFEYALFQLVHGRWLRRQSWEEEKRFFLRNGSLHDQYVERNGLIHYIIPCCLGYDDFTANDWVVIR